MRMPRLQPEKGDDSPVTDSVVLAVYAPFGSDEVLSRYPDGTSKELAQHPLFQSLLKVAAHRTHVVALIDLYGDDTYLVEIDAGRPQDVRVTSRWKQKMNEPRNLAGFLLHAHNAHPTAAVVLALEGHGAGFLPDLDPNQITLQNVTENGRFEWRLSQGQSVPRFGDGSPVLPMGNPTLPMGNPTLPGNQSPLSTWGLAEALRLAVAAGVPKLPVIHFNNCFNLSVEVMHTIAAHAHFATGYANYNFFTAGATYPSVFEQLRTAGSASAEQLAVWFAFANRDALQAKGNHPTMGGVVPLARMREVAERIDDLADALLAAMRVPSPHPRPQVVEKIKLAIRRAQQFDTTGTQELETPDELTDIRSLAHFLQKDDFGTSKVAPAAQALEKVLAGIQRYGATDEPWTDLGVVWDFNPAKKSLAMNIFLPDPRREGVWDWRSPYYLTVNPDPTKPRVQPNIIDFVKVTDWVDFLIEYHKDVKFVGLLAPSIPVFPVFNARFELPKPDTDDEDQDDCANPDGPGNPAGSGPSSSGPKGQTSN